MHIHLLLGGVSVDLQLHRAGESRVECRSPLPSPDIPACRHHRSEEMTQTRITGTSLARVLEDVGHGQTQ